MTRWIPALAMALLAPTAAFGQFADETRLLFSDDPAGPRTWDGLVILEFSTADWEETGSSGARSVEEICRDLPEEERGSQAICIGVESSGDRSAP